MMARCAAVALLATAVASVNAPHAAAHAVVAGPNTRFQGVTCSGLVYEQHWPHGEVPIYLNTTLEIGIQHLRSPNGTQWSITELIAQVRIAINEFNKNIGANVRLYYAGFTSAATVQGGIVVGTDPVGSSNDNAYASNDVSCVLAFRGQIRAARIRFRRFTATGAHKTWSGFEHLPGQIDFVGVLNHELGHAIGMIHSDKANGPGANLFDSAGLPYTPSHRCLMSFGASFSHRHWTKYEKDTLRSLYGVRISPVYAIQSGAARGYGTSWNIGTPIGLGNSVVVGPGKSSEGAAPQYMAWSSFTTSGPTMSSARRLSPNSFSQFANATFFPFDSLTAPAIAFGAGQYRIYWMERDQPVVLLNGNTADYGTGQSGHFADKRIHFATSPDAVTWTYQGFLRDPATLQPIRTFTDDVNAGFDATRSVFLVTWIDDTYNGRVMTMPAPGSPQPANVMTTLPSKFWETPAVSCRTIGPGCQLVGPIHVTTHQNPVADPYVITLNGTVSATGAYTVLNTISDTGLRTTSAVSITYSPFDDTFVLALLGSDGGSLFTRKKSSLTAGWGPSPGPIISTPLSLSPPSLGNWTDTPRGHIGLMTAYQGP